MAPLEAQIWTEDFYLFWNKGYFKKNVATSTRLRDMEEEVRGSYNSKFQDIELRKMDILQKACSQTDQAEESSEVLAEMHTRKIQL